jgi:D-glycero-D-manno-heptose 1,7-bisphosphate phosphatase
MSVKTVFIDRDGVINLNRSDHVKSWNEFEFLPNALTGLALLANHGFDSFIVTNQAIVGRGLVSHGELDTIHDRMRAAIAAYGGCITDVLACPHRPDEGCDCRKPAPGLLFRARTHYGVDLGEALLIGDHPNDLEAARRAGCRSILVLSGRVSHWPSPDLPAGCLAVLPDLGAAAHYLVREFARRRPTMPTNPLIDLADRWPSAGPPSIAEAGA